MNHHDESRPDEFEGFDEARRVMWCYEVRSRVLARLEVTSFLSDNAVTAVHVDNTSRADRVFLIAFDADGRQIGTDTLFIDMPGQRLDIAPEFDHDFTGLRVPSGSELQQAVEREFGWVIDMRALRAYDLSADRRETQRAVFLAHLKDMMRSGNARGFFSGAEGGEDLGAA